MPEPPIGRFLNAQDSGSEWASYNVALGEIRDGGKESCWISYVYPQFLGRDSEMRKKHRIHGVLRPEAVLKHEELGSRYMDISSMELIHLKAGV